MVSANCGLLWDFLLKIKIVATLTTNPIVSFEAAAFWFKIFNKKMKQKNKHNFSKNIKRKIC